MKFSRNPFLLMRLFLVKWKLKRMAKRMIDQGINVINHLDLTYSLIPVFPETHYHEILNHMVQYTADMLADLERAIECISPFVEIYQPSQIGRKSPIFNRLDYGMGLVRDQLKKREIALDKIISISLGIMDRSEMKCIYHPFPVFLAGDLSICVECDHWLREWGYCLYRDGGKQ